MELNYTQLLIALAVNHVCVMSVLIWLVGVRYRAVRGRGDVRAGDARSGVHRQGARHPRDHRPRPHEGRLLRQVRLVRVRKILSFGELDPPNFAPVQQITESLERRSTTVWPLPISYCMLVVGPANFIQVHQIFSTDGHGIQRREFYSKSFGIGIYKEEVENI